MMKGSGLYQVKRGSDEITSSFVAMTTNLIPLKSLTHAEGGMKSFNLSQFTLASSQT